MIFCFILSLFKVDQLANRIACQRNSPENILYETTLDNLFMIIIYWSEETLRALKGSSQILEISCKYFFYFLKRFLAIRSTDIELIRNTIEDCASSSSSLAVYSSFASLNANKGLRSSNHRPFSLLELLYEQDKSNLWAVTNISASNTQNLFSSDTALNSNNRASTSNPYESLLRRYDAFVFLM
jgi:hypothetical protein